MKSVTRKVLSLAAALAVPAILAAQAKPVVAVVGWDNNSIGKDRADYDGVGKGIMEMLINDMSQNSAVKVVERERIQAVITEQKLTKDGMIDATTANKVGKLVQAQYMIYGGFMSDGKGTFVLTARATNMETGQVVQPVKVTSKGDDVLALIAELSRKLNTEMKLPALRVGDAGPAGSSATPAAENKAAPETKGTKVAETKAAPQAGKSTAPVKMDMKTAMLYSKALEAEDAGNKTQAVELFRQVVTKFPTYAPAKQHLSKNGG
jgi:TolB-like protein